MKNIDLARVEKFLDIPFLEERRTGDSSEQIYTEWITVKNYGDVFLGVSRWAVDLAIANTDSEAAKNGFDDHRHFHFKIYSEDGKRVLHTKFQPHEVNGKGEDDLKTFMITEYPNMMADATALFEGAEAHLEKISSDLKEQMANLAPALITTILGDWKSFDKIKETFEAPVHAMYLDTYRLDTEFSELVHDDRMPRSFEVCADRTYDSMKESDWKNIENHQAVAYFALKYIDDRNRIATALGTIKSLDSVLKANLALAIKIETSGMAHGLDGWKERIAEASTAIEKQDRKALLHALYKIFVRKPLLGDSYLYSSGMHILGQRDFIYSIVDDESTADENVDALNAFERAFEISMGLKKADEADVELVTVTDRIQNYPPGHPCFTPYGYIEVKWK